MDDNYIAKQKRQRKACERLKTLHPQCSTCPETNPHCFEAHHIAQKRYDDTVVTLCKNCHAKVTDMQKDDPYPLDSTPVPEEQFGRMLLGIAHLLELLVQQLTRIGNWLIDQARQAVVESNSQPKQ